MLLALVVLVLTPVALKAVLVDRVCGNPVLIEALHSRRTYLHPAGRQLDPCISRARHRLSTPIGILWLVTTTVGFLLAGFAFILAIGAGLGNGSAGPVADGRCFAPVPEVRRG